jgi:hypothetical protein
MATDNHTRGRHKASRLAEQEPVGANRQVSLSGRLLVLSAEESKERVEGSVEQCWVEQIPVNVRSQGLRKSQGRVYDMAEPDA